LADNLTRDSTAQRLLADGRVVIRWCTSSIVAAVVRGDDAVHEIRWSRLAGWSCTCPADHDTRCEYVEAVASVTTRSPIRRVVPA